MQPDALAELLVETIKGALAPLRADLVRVEAELAERRAGDERRELALGIVRERLAGLEARPPVPGPPGEAGLDGRDGAPGLGFDELGATFDGERTLALTFTRGTVTKTFPFILPIPRYQGTYQAGAMYQAGDLVTWGGSAWHCQTPTASRPGELASAWRLMVKAGRDLRTPDRRSA